MKQEPFRFLMIDVHGNSACICLYHSSRGLLMARQDISESTEQLTSYMCNAHLPQWEGPAIPLPSSHCKTPDIRPDSMVIDYYGGGNFVLWFQMGSHKWPCTTWRVEAFKVKKDGTLLDKKAAMLKMACRIAERYAPANQKEEYAYPHLAHEITNPGGSVMNTDTETQPEPPPVVKDSLTAALPMDDDINEPLGPACSRKNQECESCQ